jgi:hypothetical protein
MSTPEIAALTLEQALVFIALVFFVIPAIWIGGVIRIGTKAPRLALWTLPFVFLYTALMLMRHRF